MADDDPSGAQDVPARALPGRHDVTVIVCASCRFPEQGPDHSDVSPRPGSVLAEATRAMIGGGDIGFRRVGCLGNCKRGLSAAILRDGCWSYVFGGLTTESAADLVAGARLLAGSTDGFMPFGARPESLKRGLIARIPTSANLEDLPL